MRFLSTLLLVCAACFAHGPVYDLTVSPTMAKKFKERQSSLAALPQQTNMRPDVFAVSGPMTHFASVNKTQINWLLIPRDQIEQKAMLSVQFRGVRAGDVLLFTAVQSTTNDTGFNVAFSGYICLGLTPYTCFERITPSTGENVTSAGHHYKYDMTGTYQFSASYPSVFLNTLVTAASYASDGKKRLTIHQRSEVSGIIFRGD